MTGDPRGEIRIRPFADGDRAFLETIAGRLHPGTTASPRDPETMDRFFASLAADRFLSEPGSEAFAATIDERPAGIVAVHPDVDYFTGHPRAYVDILVVAPEAEGRGVGRALLGHVEEWARQRAFREVVLDVFAGNARAIAFYERAGYAPDHIRFAKSLD